MREPGRAHDRPDQPPGDIVHVHDQLLRGHAVRERHQAGAGLERGVGDEIRSQARVDGPHVPDGIPDRVGGGLDPHLVSNGRHVMFPFTRPGPGSDGCRATPPVTQLRFTRGEWFRASNV